MSQSSWKGLKEPEDSLGPHFENHGCHAKGTVPQDSLSRYSLPQCFLAQYFVLAPFSEESARALGARAQ